MIESILNALCETPIYPIPHITYDIVFSHGISSIRFSDIEQVIDSDSNNIVLSIFHPNMLVAAWEAIILERKVLVVTSTPSILGPCCEFLRRMVLPLVSINMFVPYLPLQLIQAIEAPFPYLLGGDIADIQSSNVDLTESFIVDLDARVVIPPQNTSIYPSIRPPDSLLIRLRQELYQIMIKPLGEWNSRVHNDTETRPLTASSLSSSSSYTPLSQEYIDRQVCDMAQVFIRANISLFCARSCSVSAFYRREERENNSLSSHSHHSFKGWFTSAAAIESKKILSSMGYHCRYKVSYGFMQLFHDKPDRKDIRHFTPCWVEMDELVFAVYEFADDIPLFYVTTKDIEAVVPSSMEPEGHVFEITTKNHTIYCFATTDTDSRRLWVDFIEESMKEPTLKLHDSFGHVNNITTNSAKEVVTHAVGYDIMHEVDDIDHHDDICSINYTSTSMKLGSGVSQQSEEEEDKCIVLFRNHFMKTQMVSFLRSQIECTALNDIIFKIIDGTFAIDTRGNEAILKDFVCEEGTVISILQRIQHITVEEFIASSYKDDISATTTLPLENRVDYLSHNQILLNRSIDSIVADQNHHTPNHHTHQIQPQHSRESSHSHNVIESTRSQITSNIINSNHNHHSRNNNQHNHHQHETTPPYQSKSANTSTKRGFSITPPSIHLGLRRFFGFGSSKDHKSEMTSDEIEDLHYKQREKDLADAYIRSIKDYISDIARSRRQCDGEIRRRLVENRMKIISNIFDIMHQKESSCIKTIKIPLIDLIQSFHQPSVHNNGNNNSNNINNNNNSNGNSSNSSNGSEWFDFIWSSLHHHSTLSSEDQSEHKMDSSYEHIDSVLAYRNELTNHIESELRFARHHLKNNHFIPVYQVLLGYIEQSASNYHHAIDCYSEGNLIDSRHLMSCLSHQLKQLMKDRRQDIDCLEAHICSTKDLFLYLQNNSKLGDVNGLMAYRLVIELLYRDAISRLSTFTTSLEPSMLSPGTSTLSPEAQQMHVAEIIMKRVNSGYTDLPDFTWVEREGPPSDILNESVTCINIDPSTNPCDLSIILLTRLRELVKDYCTSPIYKDNIRWTGGPGSRCAECKLVPGLLDGLLVSSAFKSFEIQVSQFQKVNVSNLTTNQKTLFFCNMFNLGIVHGLISKGNPGTRLIERSAFMRSCKYNIGGLIYSCMDIEHGILRNTTAKPMIFGPVTAQLKFSDNDPRKAFALDEPKPNISFFLFFGHLSSPALSVLRDPLKVDEDMKMFASSYLSRHVKIVKIAHTSSIKIVVLPQMVSMFWEDFGKKRRKVLKYICKLLPPGEVADEIKAKLKDKDTFGSPSDIEFTPIDWTPAIII